MKRIIGILALCLGLAACTSDQVTATLEAAVNAAIAADAIARPQDQPILNVAIECLDNAETVLASAGTTSAKATEIAAACASAVTGLSGNTDMQALSAALNAFLKSVGDTQIALDTRPELAESFASGPKDRIPSRRALNRIRKKLDALKKKRGQ